MTYHTVMLEPVLRLLSCSKSRGNDDDETRVLVFHRRLLFGSGLVLVAGKAIGELKKILRITMIFAFPVATIILLFGGNFGMKPASAESFGGLLLTVLVASSGILGSILLGLLLALEREKSCLSSCCI